MVRDVLLTMHADAGDRDVLRAVGIDRFVAAADADYDDVRGMLDIVARAGLLPSWWWPRWQALMAADDEAPVGVG